MDGYEYKNFTPTFYTRNSHRVRSMVAANSFAMIQNFQPISHCIRLGGPVFGDHKDPHQWVADVSPRV